VINKKSAQHYKWGAGCDGWHLLKRCELSVIQERMPSGASEARHYHAKARQFFFVISGTATLEIAGEREVLRQHEGAEIPPGVHHQMVNASERDLAFIVISHPASHRDRVLTTSL
jgi:mannose-6-phosphate isomerase-like protein (cupin superfamily)